MPSKFTPPDLSNATPTSIVDELGKLSIMENFIKKQRAYYREAFYARQGYQVDGFANGQQQFQNGETFLACTTRSDPSRIDTEMLKEKYPDVAAECTKEKGQLSTRFTLKEGVVNPVVSDLLAQMKKELDLE